MITPHANTPSPDGPRPADVIQCSLRTSTSGSLQPHITLPSSFGTQSQTVDQLDSGLTLYSSDYCFQETKTFPFVVEDPRFIVLGFFLTGNISATFGKNPRMTKHYSAPMCMLGSHVTAGEQSHPAGERIRYVGVCTDLETLHRLLGDAVSLLPRTWRDETAAPPELSELPATFTPGMQMLAHQVVHDPPGRAPHRQLLLESRTLELLTLYMHSLAIESGKHLPSNDAHIPPQDRDKLHAARDILCADLTEPPSIVALARLVGMNECKLKRLFKQHFNTTVYGLVRKQRMRQAKSLLEQGMSPSQAATEVGYTNYGHFASAFRKRYGTPPSMFMSK